MPDPVRNRRLLFWGWPVLTLCLAWPAQGEPPKIPRVELDLGVPGDSIHRQQLLLFRSVEFYVAHSESDSDDDGRKEPPAAQSAEQELRRQLELERERRRLLEEEVTRLSARLDAEEPLREAEEAVQAARAEILVLQSRLEQERETRRDIETALQRVRKTVDGSGDDTLRGWLDELLDQVSDQQEEMNRLRDELREAQETIVRLRGAIESAGPEGAGPLIVRLQEENRRLRQTVTELRRVNQELQAKAALAEHLADLVYGR